MNNYEILDAIRNGMHREKYDEWLDHEDILVRATLAEMDYNPEKSIQDKNSLVRQVVLQKHPDLVFLLVGRVDYVVEVNNELNFRNNLTKEVLEKHLEAAKQCMEPLPYNHIEEKLASLEREPTALELTMTRKQLYESESPMWARDLSLIRVFNILQGIEVLD